MSMPRPAIFCSTAAGGAAPPVIALNPLRERAAQGCRRVRDHVHHDRRAAHVGHAMLGERLKNRAGLDLAQADVGSGLQGHAPGEGPAVAVEHRQGPEIDRVQADVAGQRLADRVQIGAAVMDHDALGMARGAGGVVEADRLPFVGRQERREGRIALRQKVVVGERARAARRCRRAGRARRPPGAAPRAPPAPGAPPARTRCRSAAPWPFRGAGCRRWSRARGGC